MAECNCTENPAEVAALLAVCDILVFKALETLGKWIVRADRSRFKVINGHPWHIAHTAWRADDKTVDRALKGAWDVVPAMMDGHGFATPSAKVVEMLDSYVHDLAVTGTGHSLGQLAYRFESRLGLSVATPPAQLVCEEVLT